jgi:nucleoside-diphosphate-sugar epimerase
MPLVPLSEYNKTKMVAERVLLSYADRMAVQILRPGTVCGVSPRMRLDVVVNAITMMALTEGKITIQGGKQVRPNIHIEDMTDLYLWMLNHPELTGIYNAGFENMTVSQIAEMVADYVGVNVTAISSNDPRSYRLNSDKLFATGFKPRYAVRHAIYEIVFRYETGQLKDEERWHNLKTMKLLKAA